jgi:hypothetical protein
MQNTLILYILLSHDKGIVKNRAKNGKYQKTSRFVYADKKRKNEKKGVFLETLCRREEE